MYQHQDGQIGAVTWHNAEFGEFISTTGARFTIKRDEVKPFHDGARRLKVREMQRDAGEFMPRARARVRKFASGAELAAYIRRPFGDDRGRA